MKRTKIDIYSYKGGRAPSFGKVILCLLLVFLLIFSGCLGVVLYGSHSEMEDDAEIMVILGCQVYSWGPSILLQDRLDTALLYLEEHPEMTVVVTGGKGDDEHASEAQVMFDYLVTHGIPEEQILLEDQSRNTVENMIFTNLLLAEQGYDVTEEILVVSNGFHLARTRMLFERIWGTDENLNTLAAPSSHWPSRMKMYVREPLALIKSTLLDR